MNPDLALLRGSPFVALRELLDPLAPQSNIKPISLTIGEPQNQPPELMKRVLKEHDHLYGKYPPGDGTVEQRTAIVNWLNRRFTLPDGMIEQDRHITPVNGTKEALYMLAQVLTDRSDPAAEKPCILIPNPYYHVYYAAAIMAGADPVLLHANRENNFFPDLDSLSEDVLSRCTAFFLCSPSNPQGTIADRDYLIKALELSRKHDFVLIMDECYTEIYDQSPPTGILEILKSEGGSLSNVVAFHSLSKRSSAAGLRSGFMVGDPLITRAMLNLRNFAGAASPLPVCAASAALWADDEHVASNRTRYKTNIDIAEKHLKGRFGFYRPPGGFFLWIDVGDGVDATKKLWTKAAIRVLPGEFLSVTDHTGFNPGRQYIRIALVFDPEVMEEALSRMVNVL
ncbi:aminotransferase class I/II-fold pyridoxal phosphate-dependent enzyme [Sneathiella aquimaris]|uniref:aminotransferase class I/II-fold pyridoxal phosphate-dependent enzyme n=1 Tax=Sneathiella aquimaris TaxID=2599305 RepID=UPI00146A38CF|nr:aminotransferase class I/II-fold pyridoxal phosphate-dependent enzyme [Sneathiella aquimaris]